MVNYLHLLWKCGFAGKFKEGYFQRLDVTLAVQSLKVTLNLFSQQKQELKRIDKNNRT